MTQGREREAASSEATEVRVCVSVALAGGKVQRASVLYVEEHDPDSALREADDDECDRAENYVREKLDVTMQEVAFVAYSGEWSWSEAKARLREAFMGRGFNALWHEAESMVKESYERGLREGRRRR